MALFIAYKIPKESVVAIRDAMRSYQDSLAISVPQEKWHSTVLYLGDTELSPESIASLTRAIPQSFHPVIKVLSLGEGKVPGKLWAYIQPNALLDDIRAILLKRFEGAGIPLAQDAKKYIPHIQVGTLKTQGNTLMIPDSPVKTSFSLRELSIMKSTPEHPDMPYEELATISVTP